MPPPTTPYLCTLFVINEVQITNAIGAQACAVEPSEPRPW
jgi:hypothetical protein